MNTCCGGFISCLYSGQLRIPASCSTSRPRAVKPSDRLRRDGSDLRRSARRSHSRERLQANHRQRGHPFNRAPCLGKSPQECFMKTSNRERSFPFLTINERESKPRKRGLTEIRGPYYTFVGRRYLEDLFETMGSYADSLKSAG